MTKNSDIVSRAIRELKKPKGILFDLGDTILRQKKFDREAGTARVLELAENPKGLSVKDIQDLVKELDADLCPRREAAMIEFPPQMIYRLVYEPHGITFTHALEDVELEFWKTAMQFSPEPEVEVVLDSLMEFELPMGIVSNAAFSGRALSWELAHHGLSKYFKFLMSSADYVVRKPHPLILFTAAAKIGLEPADLWYVGNSLQYDVTGALNAGMGAIWYNRIDAPCDGPKPDAEVRSWMGFLNIIEELSFESS